MQLGERGVGRPKSSVANDEIYVMQASQKLSKRHKNQAQVGVTDLKTSWGGKKKPFSV